MARDISKLKDKLHAVKGLDSSSAYNAEDEEEKKKKQAAQLKSQAQANAVKQALEKTRSGNAAPKYTTYEAPLKQTTEVQTRSSREAMPGKEKERATSGKSVTQSRKDQTTSILQNIGEALKASRAQNMDAQRTYSDLSGLAAGAKNAAVESKGWAAEAAEYGNNALKSWYQSAEKQLTATAANAQRRITEMLSPASRQQEVENENTYARLLDYWTDKAWGTGERQATEEEITTGAGKNESFIAELEKKQADGTITSAEERVLQSLYKAREAYDSGDVSVYDNDIDEAQQAVLDSQQGYLQSRTNVDFLAGKAQQKMQEISDRQIVPVVLDRMQQAGASVEDYEAEREALYQDYMDAGSLKTVFKKDYDLLNYTPEQYAAYRWTEENEPENLDYLKEYLDISANARISQDAQEYWSDPDRADGMNNIFGNTVLGITGRLSGLINTADIALQSLAVAGGARNRIDYNRTGWGVQVGEGAVSAQAEKLAELGNLGDAIPGLKDTWLGELNLGDLYRNGVDSAVSILNGAMFGVGAGAAMTAQVYSSGFADAKERGASDKQAGLFAAFSAAAEGLGEQVSFGTFQKLIVGRGMDKKVGGKILLGLFQTAEEGGQEFVTEGLNILADRFIMQDLSQEELQAQAYMAQGYDPDTAREIAKEENNERLMDAALSGFIGGAMRSGGAYAAQGISNAADSVQTAIDDRARGRQIQKMGNAQQMAQLMSEVTGETVTPETNKRKLGKQQREFIENAGEYVSGADEATRDIVRGKVYDVANASTEALDGTSQAAKEKAGKRSAAMKTSDTGASMGGESVAVQGFVKTAEKGSDAKLNIKKADGTLAEADMEDVTFDSKTAEVYSYAADMATAELANDFRMRIQPDQMGSIERVANGYAQAYDMARAGFKEASIRASSLTGALTDDQVSAAYKLGAEARKSEQIATIAKAAERAKANMGNAWKGGKATFDDSVVVDALDDTQKAQIDVASVFTGSMGVNVVFFESKADETGRYTRENGSYNRRTNTVYIDVNAGRYYKGDSPSKTALLRTLSHEVTHAIQRNSPEIYAELRDTVTDILGDAKGVTIEDLIDRKMAADSSLTTRDAAMDELVADACERMIEDSDAAQRLAEAHPEAAKTIFQKVGELLKKISDAIKAAFKGRQLSTEAQLVMKDMERYQAVVDLWTKGVMETAEISGREYAETEASEDENTAISEETAAESEEVTSGEAVGLYNEPAQSAETHIDNRTWENVGERSVKAFMNEYRGVRAYMYPALQILRSDVRDSTRGERLMIRDEEGYAQGMTGQQRETTDQIAELKDRGYTWEQLSETLDMLENELRASGEENTLPDTAIVKRIELALDDMLTNGYDSLGGGMGVHYAPDAEYIKYKASLPGAAEYDVAAMEQAEGRQFVDDVQFQARSFSEQIDELAEGVFPRNDHLYVMQTPDVLVGVGLKKLPMLMTQRHAKTVMKTNGNDRKANYHGLTKNGIKQLPQRLSEPAMIIQATGYSNRVIVLTDMQNGSGETVIAPIMLDGRGNWQDVEIDANILTTAYGKENIKSMIVDAIMDDRVLYTDKKRSDTLSQTVGVQFPKNLRSGGFIHSIRRNQDVVNPDIQHQTREEAISTRFVLANMLEADATNSEEAAWLRGYKGRLNELEMVLDAIEGNRQTVRELMFEEKTLSDGKRKLVMRKRTPDETERLKKAQNRIKILQEQVARMDEGLLNLENADVIRSLVRREEQKIRDREAEKRREGVAKIQESHRTQAIRKNVIRRAKRLDKMLREPTAKDHIPDRLKAAMVDMLQTFTDTKGGDAFGGDRISRERLQHAKLGYDQMFKEYAEDYPQLAAMYDEATSHRLMELSELLDGRRLYDLNFREITELSNVVGHFEKIVSDANEEFDENRKNSIKANAMEMHDTMATMEGRKENYFNGNMLAKSLRELKQGQITPPYFFKRLGGSLGRLGTELLKGEGKYGVNAQRAAERVADIKKKHNYDKWADKKNDRIKIKTEEGQELTLTREEALGIWATQKRETRDKYHQTSHLSQGGVVIDKRAKKLSWRGEIDNRNPIRLTKTDVAHIAEQLTDEQMSYADEMVGYISRDLAELGNETSMELMGYKVFGEGYYYPYRTSSDFLPTKLGDAEAALIRNMGFTKAVTRRAKTPIVITDFTTTVTEHISNMLMYNALAVSQDRFMRVFDYKFDDGKSIKSMLGTTYGPELQKYIVQFMNDVYGGKATKKAPLSKMTSLHKKQAVLASMSVVVQQPTAVMRAMSMVNPKYFLAQGAKVTTKAFEEAKHYAGTAVIKDMGRFDTGIGRTAGEYIAGKATEGMRNWIDESAGWLAGKADEWGWSYIWDAVKREQAAKTGLDIKSEELKMIAGERFDEVVRYTQVYDSVMTKSELMRSKDGLTQMITSFMAEPTVTYNMMLDMVQEFRHGSKKKAGAVLGSVVGSIILANAAKALWVAFRDDDDDDDKTLWEHFFEKMASGMANDINPLNYIPVVKDLYSILQGYDVERSDVTAFTDLVQAIKIMSNEDKDVEQRWKSALTALGLVTDVPIKNLWRDMYPIGKRVYSLAKGERWREPQREGAIQKAVLRGVQDDPLINLAVDFMSETMDLFSNADSRKEYVEELYEAALADDNTMAARMRGQMKQYVKSGDGYIDDKGINSELRTRIKEGFTAGEIGADEAIEMLTGYAGMSDIKARDTVAEWKYTTETGEPYSKLKEQFLEGEITDDEAIAARQEFGSAYEADAERSIAEWQYEKDTGRAWSDMKYDYLSGEMTAKEVIAAQKKYVDAFEWDVKAQILKWDYERDKGRPYNEMKAAYIEGDITAKEAIADRVKYGGMNKEDAELDISKWNFEIDYGYPYDDMKDYYRLGRISKDKAIAARVKYGKQEQDEAYFAVTGWEYEQSEGKEWHGKFTKVHDAIDAGNDSALTKAIKEVYDHSAYEDGKKAASALTSNITSTYKPLYIEASDAERAQMEEDLLEAYRYAYELAGEKYYGDSRKLKAIRKWLEEDE